MPSLLYFIEKLALKYYYPYFLLVHSYIFMGAWSNVYTFMAITIPMLTKLIMRG